MKFSSCLIFLTLAIVVFATQKFSYEGYQLFRVTPNSIEDSKLLQEIEETPDSSFDIWNIHRETGQTDVLISPNAVERYIKLFQTYKMKYTILDLNIQNKINEEERLISERIRSGSKNILYKYARYPEIMNFLESTALDNPDIATVYSPGATVENRQLKTIKLKAPNPSTNKAIWIDCGIHAREWVTPATCVYIIDQLIKEYRSGEADNLLKKYEVHVMPLLNADGYEYSHNSYRLWRKNCNRNFNPSNPSQLYPPGTCVGTDLNRNFAWGWRTGGSSIDPCSETFSGPRPESENETKAVVNAISANVGNWAAFFNIHSYGNWWLTPYGNSTTVRPSNYNDMIAKAQIGADALKAYNGQGQVFKVGTSASLLYINSGSAKDWARGQMNIPYAYVLELRPSQTDPTDPDSTFGFLLPENRMVKVAPETFAGIKACVNAIN